MPNLPKPLLIGAAFLGFIYLYPGAAHAQDPGSYFISVDAGRSHQGTVNNIGNSLAVQFLRQFNQGLLSAYEVSSANTATGFGIHFGYRLDRRVAFTLGYEDFGSATGDYSLTGSSGGKAGGSFSIRNRGVLLTVLSHYNFTQEFRVYGNLGLIYAKTDFARNCNGPASLCQPLVGSNSVRKWAPMLEFGLEYRFIPQLSGRIGYGYYYHLGDGSIGGRTNIRYLSLGLVYGF